MGLVLLTIGYRHQNARRGGHLLSTVVGLVALSLALQLTPPDAQADEALTYDANGNIVTRTLPSGSTTYGYDALDRINSEAGPAKTQSLTYDGNDNRLSDAAGSKTYTPNSDRLATENGSAITLDATGNTTAARGYTYTWTQAGQLKTVSQGATLLATYTYDYQGRRTRKVTTASAPQGAATVVYHYDQQGHLLAETTATGSPIATYVWREDTPVSIIVAGSPETALYLETDHLGTPIAARDQQGKVVWKWESDAFGTTAANEDPDADGKKVTINLRFPGQYFDKESGLHQNWRRYYDPKLGRYLSSDPIGLAGGGNTFGYVGGNPLRYTDPAGLAARPGSEVLGYKQCNSGEMRECRAQCGNRGVDRCRVRVSRVIVGVGEGGERDYDVKREPLCSCNDEDSSCPTNEESQFNKFMRRLTGPGSNTSDETGNPDLKDALRGSSSNRSSSTPTGGFPPWLRMLAP